MDLQQQMLLAAWLRPGFLNSLTSSTPLTPSLTAPSLTASTGFNNHDNGVPETAASSSSSNNINGNGVSSSSSMSAASLRQLLSAAAHHPQPHQPAVIRRVTTSTPLGIFDTMANGTENDGGAGGIGTGLFPEMPNFGGGGCSHPNTSTNHPLPHHHPHPAGLASSALPPPQLTSTAAQQQQQLDQLMAVAFHQMLERLATQKAVQMVASGQIGQSLPLLHHHATSAHFGLPSSGLPSAFSSVLPSPQTPEPMMMQQKPHHHHHPAPPPFQSSAIHAEEQRPQLPPPHHHQPSSRAEPKAVSQNTPQPQQQQPQAPRQFVPNPSTSAAELLAEAMQRLVQLTDAEQQAAASAEMGNGGGGGKTAGHHHQTTTTTTITTDSNEAPQSAGSADPCTAAGTLPPPSAPPPQPPPSSAITIGQQPGEEMLLCKVCSDRASGFHYGIFSCEGCKGFFRRSLHHKNEYRPCTQSQRCQIVRSNRNRCQECRWRKCIEAGMSKDGVRYGRVPKREKEKLREEMRRDSVRSLLDQLALELVDEHQLLERLDRAWAQLGAELADQLAEDEEKTGTDSPQQQQRLLLDAGRLCSMAAAIARFAGRLNCFRVLRREERAQLLKDSMFPVLLLRLCSLRMHSSRKDDDDEKSAPMLVDLSMVPRALQLGQQNEGLRECAVEFVLRLREAQPPTELALSDRQLAICAAICLCRLDGAGECASGGLTSASASMGNGNAWDEQSGQLDQAVCRRIRERLLQLLNTSLGLYAQDRPSPVICHFGPSPLRTDLMMRQNLAALFERLKQCRDLHGQLLLNNQCFNVPAQLFAVQPQQKHSSPPQLPIKFDDLSPPAAVKTEPSSVRKRKSGETEAAAEHGASNGHGHHQQPEKERRPKQELLPTLRRALEEPPLILTSTAGVSLGSDQRQTIGGGLANGHSSISGSQQTSTTVPPTTTTGCVQSLRDQHREVAQLLEAGNNNTGNNNGTNCCWKPSPLTKGLLSAAAAVAGHQQAMLVRCEEPVALVGGSQQQQPVVNQCLRDGATTAAVVSGSGGGR